MHDPRWWRGAALFLLVSMLAPAPAFAYIGPGVAAGAVASALGVLGSILLGIFSVIYYPIKRLFKKRKSGKRVGGKAESTE
jgi:membrane protein implicated in regulation of membrane protease activity